ncbi:hypothetical protein [Cellulomonas dongxiuzhuiae]|uniref:Uncharacterized protein n=1 Tax=Cellulomonas dongxiuzhuiae TaxID=2819979 RepID=A0ABX8GJ39_9CELL|nr:hypothetical protein [Cellulomonas dongxiuzhuiae]MBO3089143.1 hypothetical protein [Cellulomonas dongxiuzhuiae]MBO3095077.1 hypothetical protein [Cellulomonas dongxiuzhuiae]QWC16089.1 hypothetical protein KKR89_17935 [Cellulomonas dongxiuzhuiae]
MVDEQREQGDGDADVKGARGVQNGAFLAIGLVFFVLGLSGMSSGDSSRTAFFAIGVVFMALSAVGANTSAKGREGGGGGEAAAVDGDSGPDGGGGDGGGGGGGDA